MILGLGSDLPSACYLAKLKTAVAALVFGYELFDSRFDRLLIFVQYVGEQPDSHRLVCNEDYRFDCGDQVCRASGRLLSQLGGLFAHDVGSTFLSRISPNVFFCTSFTLSVRTISRTAMKAVTSSRCECISSKKERRLSSE